MVENFIKFFSPHESVKHINKKKSCINDTKIIEKIDDVVKEIVDIADNKLVKQLNIKKINYPKPILKWVGGKTQILDKLIVEFPTEINNYHEIFLGGGSVLLTLLSYVKNGIIKIHGSIHAYDLNEPLIYIYKYSIKS